MAKANRRRLRIIDLTSLVCTYFIYLLRLGGSQRDKIKVINDYVLERFNDARRNFGTVHDIDLRKWAMRKKVDVGMNYIYLLFYEFR